MSTELHNSTHETEVGRIELSATRTVRQGKLGITLSLWRSMINNECVWVSRKEWVTLRDSVDAGFAEFPVCEVCDKRADTYAEDFIVGAGKVCSDCYKDMEFHKEQERFLGESRTYKGESRTYKK